VTPCEGGDEVVFVVRGPVERQDVPGVVARLREQLSRHGETTTVVVDARELGPAGAAALEVLARIRLTAGRRPVRFTNVPRRLRDLVEWVGLGHLLGVEPGRHAEQGEEVRGGGRGGVCGEAPVLGLYELLGLGREEDGQVADPPPGDL
jgi:ABC-type transporter Mla MlaB component